MSLNDIQLSPAVVAGLYPESLVLTGEQVVSAQPVPVAKPTAETVAPVAPGKEEMSWKFLGSNQQHILILVKYENIAHIPDDMLTFLTKMLSACKLSLGDVAVMNYQHYEGSTFRDMNTFFNSKTVLLFDIEPAVIDLPVRFPAFQVQSVSGTSFLYAPSLEECRDDKLVKSKLWVGLQRIFNIS